MRRPLVFVVALVVILALLAACTPGSGWVSTPTDSGAYSGQVDSRSSSFVAEIMSGAHVADVTEYGMPTFDGDWSGSPTRTVNCTASWCNGTGRDGMTVPIPPGFHWSTGSDHAAAIWDQGRGQVFGFWDCSSLSSSTLTCQDASRSAEGSQLNGVTTTGAGLEPRAGILTRADLDAGRADHPLVFSTGAVNCGGSYRFPVTKTDGPDFGPCASVPVPEGTKFAVDPSLDVDALGIPAWNKVLLKAGQEFGWIVVDHGGSGNDGAFFRFSDDTGVPDYAGVYLPSGRIRALSSCAC